MSYLATLTAEERDELRQKGAEKKRAKMDWAKANLKTEWADEKFWRELSTKHGFRLPVWYEPAGAKFVGRFLRHFGLDKDWYTDHTGYANGNKEVQANPKMPAFAQVGLLLEAYDEEVG